MKIIEDGTVTNPKGYKGAGLHIGIKKRNKDFALIVSDVEAKAVGTFTTNMVKAAPVLWDKQVVENSDTVKAIAINSGIANACTGKLGEEANEKFANIVGNALNVEKEKVLICSTGVIGKQLSTDPIEKGIDEALKQLKDDHQAGIDVATSIMTTDTKPKHLAVEIEVKGKTVTIGACCKGSGMIHPNMATMLAFVTSDVAISKECLEAMVHEVVDDTFNMVSVDGDTSTNDMLCVLSNGMAQNNKIVLKDQSYNVMKDALYHICEQLSRGIAKDGEGATKLLTCNVKNAKTLKDAKIVAKSVITSTLFKAAMFGRDANWGRILCAIGYSDADLDINKVSVTLASSAGDIHVCEKGMGVIFDEDKALKVLSEDEIDINIDLNDGMWDATAWGCDLTYDYVKINGEYRT